MIPKFRAWDIEQKKYIRGCCNLMLDLNGMLYWQFGLDAPFPVSREDYILEQSTGIHDKEGNEVFEGDVVTYFNDSNEFPYVVGFQDGDCVMKGIGGGWGSLGGQSNLVIKKGNVHDNPEVLSD